MPLLLRNTWGALQIRDSLAQHPAPPSRDSDPVDLERAQEAIFLTSTTVTPVQRVSQWSLKWEERTRGSDAGVLGLGVQLLTVLGTEYSYSLGLSCLIQK